MTTVTLCITDFIDDEKISVFELLLKNFDINKVDDNDNTLLHIACDKKQKNCAEMLIKKGININAVNKDGNAAVHLACDMTDIIKMLIDNGAIINKFNGNGHNVLHIACLYGCFESVKLLLENKYLDVNIKNRFGNTPVITAGLLGYKNIVELLIKEGADLHVTNYIGQNFFNVVVNPEIKELLEKYKINVPIAKVNNNNDPVFLQKKIKELEEELNIKKHNHINESQELKKVNDELDVLKEKMEKIKKIIG
jgi:ankyrin repeat protein